MRYITKRTTNKTYYYKTLIKMLSKKSIKYVYSMPFIKYKFILLFTHSIKNAFIKNIK